MKIVYKLLIALFFVGMMGGCKKEYFIDSGIHDAKFNGSIVDYLKTKPEYFDTLVTVIDLAEMGNYLAKEEVTFFAPPNTCISDAVRGLNEYLRQDGKDTVSQLSQIKSEVWKELLSLYVFKGKYSLKDIPQLDTLDLNAYSGQGYESINGRPMNIGLLYNDAGGVKYSGYRQLWLSYIKDFSNPNKSRVNIPVATSNIEPLNGILHVLRFKGHMFGFTRSNFILQATSKGIDPAL